jgi:hypothetical protein
MARSTGADGADQQSPEQQPELAWIFLFGSFETIQHSLKTYNANFIQDGNELSIIPEFATFVLQGHPNPVRITGIFINRGKMTVFYYDQRLSRASHWSPVLLFWAAVYITGQPLPMYLTCTGRNRKLYQKKLDQRR